jgi:hypothetical protein
VRELERNPALESPRAEGMGRNSLSTGSLPRPLPCCQPLEIPTHRIAVGPTCEGRRDCGLTLGSQNVTRVEVDVLVVAIILATLGTVAATLPGAADRFTARRHAARRRAVRLAVHRRPRRERGRT